MENKSISIKKYILKYGILFGIASVILSFIIYKTGNYVKQNLFHSTILFFITITAIMIGLIIFKKKNKGYISLSEGLKIGIGISIIGGLIAVLWKILLLKVIDPEIINIITENHFKRIVENSTDFTQENLDKQIAIVQEYTSPFTMVWTALAEDLFVGFLLSLIGGLIIRKKRDPFS